METEWHGTRVASVAKTETVFIITVSSTIIFILIFALFLSFFPFYSPAVFPPVASSSSSGYFGCVAVSSSCSGRGIVFFELGWSCCVICIRGHAIIRIFCSPWFLLSPVYFFHVFWSSLCCFLVPGALACMVPAVMFGSCYTAAVCNHMIVSP